MPASSNSPYINSLKGNFNPKNKTEKKAKLGSPSRPVLNQNPKTEKIRFGKGV